MSADLISRFADAGIACHEHGVLDAAFGELHRRIRSAGPSACSEPAAAGSVQAGAEIEPDVAMAIRLVEVLVLKGATVAAVEAMGDGHWARLAAAAQVEVPSAVVRANVVTLMRRRAAATTDRPGLVVIAGSAR